MKKVLFTCLMASAYLTANSNVYTITIAKEIIAQVKIDIKIKNDTSEALQVYNAGSGGTYSLTKGATTTIKMEEGDKLYISEKGKKVNYFLKLRLI